MGDGTFEPCMMATAIGSMPHDDAAAAVDLVLEIFPEAPFWPQLPALGFREGMMVQYVEGLPGARLDETRRRAVLDIDEAVSGMEAIEAAFAASRTAGLGPSPAFAAGYHEFLRRLGEGGRTPCVVKGHVTGPVTLALGLETSFEERAAIYEPDLARLVARLVGLKARAQEERFAEVAPEAETLVFFDEPSLGSIGSAVLNLDADLAVELLATATSACRGMPGIHCCGETDLGLLLEAGLRVINFDAYDYLDSVVAAGPAVRTFVERGGSLAIGVVPSSLPRPDAVADETLDRLWARLVEVLDTLAATGLDRDLLLSRSWITPSCGTSGMRPDLAERSLRLTAELARRGRERFGLSGPCVPAPTSD